MIKVRGLDVDWDWIFGGSSAYVEESEYVKQAAQTILKSHKYDWFLNLQHGINWLRTKPGEISQLKADINALMLEIPYIVEAATDINYNPDTRRISVTVEITAKINDKTEIMEVTEWRS